MYHRDAKSVIWSDATAGLPRIQGNFQFKPTPRPHLDRQNLSEVSQIYRKLLLPRFAVVIRKQPITNFSKL